jgi:iron complex transport system substrate-binding protein
MIFKKQIPSLLLVFLLLAGCTANKRKQAVSTRSITDMAGRVVEIPVEITSIFAGRHPIHAIYAFDTAITVNRVFNYSETEKKFLKKSFYENKPYVLENGDEEMIRLHPDIVLYAETLTPDVIEKMDKLQEKVQIPVVLLDNNILNCKQTLAFMGDLLHKEEKAEALIQFIQTYIDPALEKAKTIPEAQKKSIYYAEGMKGLKTDPSGSVHSLLIDLLGGKNVAQVDILPGKGMSNVSLEQVYAWNPDLILVWSGNFDGMDSYTEIKTNSAWANLEAVKNNQVYQVPWKPFGWIDRPPGINRLIGIIWLAHLLYPEMYAHEDITGIIREYFQLFWHYDMTEEEAKEIMNPQPKINE